MVIHVDFLEVGQSPRPRIASESLSFQLPLVLWSNWSKFKVIFSWSMRGGGEDSFVGVMQIKQLPIMRCGVIQD